MKRHLLASAFLVLTSYFAFAVTLDWPVETTRVAPVTFDAYHGETLVLKPSFYERLKPLAITNYAACIYWQTNGMDAAYWQTNTCTVASNTVTATFLGAFDPGASAVKGFVALAATNATAQSPIYRAAFTIRYRASPGYTPGALPLPAQTIDCATVTFLNPTNAPWASGGGGTGGGISAATATNIATTVVTNMAFTKSETYDRAAILTNLSDYKDAAVYEAVNTVYPLCYPKTSGNTLAATVQNWEDYWQGDKVRLSVTNYYGNTSGELPRLRIEEFDHSTTNGTVVSNFYHVVWDEESRHTNYQAQVDAQLAAISNKVLTAAWMQTTTQLAGKAPKAWQGVTSAGEDAPPNTVWHTAPNTVFAGGTEYAHVAVGEGTVCVLVDNGANTYTEGEEGEFRFMDDSGENYFGFDVRSSYTLGCRTDGISINAATHMVSLTYDLVASDDPQILTCTNLCTGTWSEVSVTWEENPPANTKICYIDVGSQPQGYYKAQMVYAGGSKFVTNMQADLAGGIAASNEVQNVVQSIVPYITSTGVVWRVKQ